MRYHNAIFCDCFGRGATRQEVWSMPCCLMKRTMSDPVSKTPEIVSKKKGHGHLADLGFASLVAYFFCMFASASIRSEVLDSVVPDEGALVSLLAFVGSACLMLLFLALTEPYMLRHDNHGRLGFVSAVLLIIGPIFQAIENISGTSNSFATFCSFALSGCGYALCLLVWGRILSVKQPSASSRQVLADTCAAAIGMVAVSIMPELVSIAVMLCLGLFAGLIGSRKAVAAQTGKGKEEQVVVSDTRNAIPRSAYFVGGTLWLVYGVIWSLLSGVHVFSGYLSFAEVAVVAIAAVAGIAIVRLHRRPAIDLSKISWASIPLLVTGLAMLVAGNDLLLRLAVVLIVFSMIISHLHLMAHFAALAHRPDLLSDQLFSWGWLAPYAGMCIGVIVGIVCGVVGDVAIKLFLPIMVGVLVVTLIVSMRSVEKITSRRRDQQAAEAHESDTADIAMQMDEVFSLLGLSRREKDVAALLLQGRSQAVIADQLFVASSTVNTHVKHIYQKTGVNSKQEFIDVCQEKLQASVSDAQTSDKSKLGREA